jgi:hypothetical protein
VVQVEVPSRDVVGVTVAVVLLAVGEGDYQVLGREQPVDVLGGEARVLGVVVDVEGSVVVGVVGRGSLGLGELSFVDVGLRSDHRGPTPCRPTSWGIPNLRR